MKIVSLRLSFFLRCVHAYVCVFFSGILCRTSDTFIWNGIMSTVHGYGWTFVCLRHDSSNTRSIVFMFQCFIIIVIFSTFFSVFPLCAKEGGCVYCLQQHWNTKYSESCAMHDVTAWTTRHHYSIFPCWFYTCSQNQFFYSYPTWLVCIRPAFPTLWSKSSTLFSLYLLLCHPSPYCCHCRRRHSALLSYSSFISRANNKFKLQLQLKMKRTWWKLRTEVKTNRKTLNRCG